MKTPRFIYFGTPAVAQKTLAALVGAGYTPALVVTSPDAPKGRGLSLSPCSTRAWAMEHALETFTPEKIDDAAITHICNIGADFAIVVAYGKILPQALIDVFPKGILNIHYSLLPKYRGASPVEAALLHGDTITGVSIQKMVFALDAGDVLAVRETPIAPEETARELRPRLITLGADLLIETLPSFITGTHTLTPQDETKASRCKKIKKEDGELSLSGDTRENWNKYRAYAEWPGTYFFTERGGKNIRVKITTASFKNGSFIIERVIPEGKREMAYVDFMRGV